MDRQLARRQQEILWLVARGMTNKEIARELSISDQTVKNTLVVIYQKLRVDSRTGAAVRALCQGLFDDEVTKVYS